MNSPVLQSDLPHSASSPSVVTAGSIGGSGSRFRWGGRRSGGFDLKAADVVETPGGFHQRSDFRNAIAHGESRRTHVVHGRTTHAHLRTHYDVLCVFGGEEDKDERLNMN